MPIEEHVARDAEDPCAFALARLVVPTASDDAEKYFLGQVFRGRRITGQAPEVAMDRAPVLFEDPSGQPDLIAHRG